jgi:hypothetical protein
VPVCIVPLPCASRGRTFRADDEAAGSEVRPAGAQCGAPDQTLRRCAMAGGEPALLCWREGEGAQREEVLSHIGETPTASRLIWRLTDA